MNLKTGGLINKLMKFDKMFKTGDAISKGMKCYNF